MKSASKNIFTIPYLFNPGVLTGRLPNHLLSKVKKAVNDPNARKTKDYSSELVASIKNEYETPKIPGLVEYLHEMYQTWVETFQIEKTPYQINPIWTNYMKKGEFNPNHVHPGVLAAFVIWVTIPYDVNEELKYNGYNNTMYPCKNSAFEFTYSTFDGRIIATPIYVDKTMEGTVTMFPGSLTHCVYPFFTSDSERISIAGNVTAVTN